MTNSKMTLVLLVTLCFFVAPSLAEAQVPPLTINCDPIAGTYLVFITFTDPGVYAQFDVTVNGVLTAIVPSAGIGMVLTTLVTLPGPGGYLVCVQGVGGPGGVSPLACCQFAVPPNTFIRGDANVDGAINIADIVTELSLLFSGLPVLCLDAADSNDDGAIDIADPIYLVWYVLGSGPAPPPPHTACGPDPTLDPLDCASFPLCP